MSLFRSLNSVESIYCGKNKVKIRKRRYLRLKEERQA